MRHVYFLVYLRVKPRFQSKMEIPCKGRMAVIAVSLNIFQNKNLVFIPLKTIILYSVNIC